MPRTARIDHPGLLHHVIARGIERRKIFQNNADYNDFLSRLEIGLAKSGGQCLAWALMPNHIHLLIRSGERGLAALMRSVLTGYAVNFNHRYKRVGHLFQNRYKSTVCQEETYLLELVRYIHLNPLRAKIVKNIEQFRKHAWSGHAVLLGHRKATWQSTAEVLNQFGSNAIKNYEQFVLDGWKKGAKNFEGGVIQNLKTALEDPLGDRVLGDPAFVKSTLEKGKNSTEKQMTLQEVLDFVKEKTGVGAEKLVRKNRGGEVVRAKSLFIALGVDVLNQSGREMAQRTKMSCGAVSRALQRGREILDKNGWIY